MKSRTRLSIVLIAISLTLPLWSALYMIPFVQPERAQIAARELHYMFSYENIEHEAGFARLTLSIIALLILLIPFQRGARWAFAALVILAVAYNVPIFFFGAIPNSGTWPIFRNLPQPRDTNPAREYWSVVFVTGCLILGLAISAPTFFRRKGHWNPG